MKNLLLITSLILSLFSCSQQLEKISGDLYFGFWRYGSFYKQPKKVIQWVEKMALSDQKDTLDTTSKDILRIYTILKKEKLLYSPYIQLIQSNDSIVRIYLNKKDYKRIKKHKVDDLQNKNEKVSFDLEVKKIGEGLYFCMELNRINRISGQTYPKQTKFKLEDYP